MEKIKSCLEGVEHPFKWDPRASLTGDEKVESNEEEVKRKPEKRLFISLVLMYEYGLKGQWEKSLDILDTFTEFIEDTSDISNHLVVQKYPKAYNCTRDACKVYILSQLGRFTEAEKALKNVELMEKLDVGNQAAILAMKSTMFSAYRREGVKISIDTMDAVIKMVPGEAFWYFLKSRWLSKLRHFETPAPPPSSDELSCLEICHSLSPSALFCCTFAQAHAEFTRAFARTRAPDEFKTLEYYQNKTFFLARQVLESNDSFLDPKSIIRCGRILLELPSKFNASQEGFDLIHEGLKSLPNDGTAHHVLACYYVNRQMFNKALEHAVIADEVGKVNSGLLRSEIETILDRDFDPSELFAELIKRHPSHEVKVHAKASAFYFVKGDLFKCHHHFMEGLKSDKSGFFLKKVFHRVPDFTIVLNMCEILVNELKKALQEEEYGGIKRNTIETTLSLLREIAPEEFDKPIIENKLEELISRRKNEYQQRRGRGRGRGGFPRSRGAGRGESWRRFNQSHD